MEDHRRRATATASASPGPGLEPKAPLEMRSHGIVPGVIQVPHSGQPIVQMRDAQPSGGYPKVGTVIEADLWRLGQTPIGSRFRFVETTGTRRWPRDEALDAGSRRSGALASLPAGTEGGVMRRRTISRRSADATGCGRTSARLELTGPGRPAACLRARRRAGAGSAVSGERGAGGGPATWSRSRAPAVGTFLRTPPAARPAARRRRRRGGRRPAARAPADRRAADCRCRRPPTG